MSSVDLSYRCKVNADHKSATLSIGWKSFPVEVEEVSRDLFSIVASEQAAKRLGIGRTGKLTYDGIAWEVACARKFLCDGDVSRGIGIELDKVAELTQLTLPKTPWWHRKSNQVRAINADPVIPVAMLVAFLVAVLIMPRSGNQWGLLEGVSKGAANTWHSFKSK